MTTPVVVEDISELDFSIECEMGPIVQPDLGECPEEAVWAMSCPECPDSWTTCCQKHRDLVFANPHVGLRCPDCKHWRLPGKLTWHRL